jgi:hypothetical protein
VLGFQQGRRASRRGLDKRIIKAFRHIRAASIQGLAKLPRGQPLRRKFAVRWLAREPNGICDFGYGLVVPAQQIAGAVYGPARRHNDVAIFPCLRSLIEGEAVADEIVSYRELVVEAAGRRVSFPRVPV